MVIALRDVIRGGGALPAKRFALDDVPSLVDEPPKRPVALVAVHEDGTGGSCAAAPGNDLVLLGKLALSGGQPAGPG